MRIGQVHVKRSLIADADNEGQDETAHKRSLIRDFGFSLQNHRIPFIASTNGQRSGHTVRMRRLIWAFIVRIWHNDSIGMLRLI